MDITKRKITKIAREAEKLVLVSLREEGVGTAEIDLIHALRHNPGCIEAKGYLIRTDAPNDRRSQLLYPTEKAEKLKSSKEEIESSFYEYLTSALTESEADTFAELLDKLYNVSKTESRSGFPHFMKQ